MARPRLPVWKILSLRCDEATLLISLSLDEELTRTERMAIAVHTFLCRSCKLFRRQMRLLRETIGLSEHTHAGFSLSPEARARIKKALDGSSASPEAKS